MVSQEYVFYHFVIHVAHVHVAIFSYVFNQENSPLLRTTEKRSQSGYADIEPGIYTDASDDGGGDGDNDDDDDYDPDTTLDSEDSNPLDSINIR